VSADDDRAVMERLAALEAEVKADADAQRVRKEAAIVKVREQRAAQQAASDSLRMRQAELVSKKKRASDDEAASDSGDRGVDIGDTLALAKRAHGVQQELTKPRKTGDKSWVKSGLASGLLGPVGWLYAGSLREAIPGAAAYVAFLALASKILPMVLLMPVMLVALPLSAIAGVVYAMQYNKTGKRQRLFGKGKAKKQLASSSE
jgi:hypothetical protein